MRHLRRFSILFWALFPRNTLSFQPHNAGAALPLETTLSSSSSSSSSSGGSCSMSSQQQQMMMTSPSSPNDINSEEKSRSSFKRLLLRVSSINDSYYLIWSPRMIRSLITWTAALTIGNWFFPFASITTATSAFTTTANKMSFLGYNVVLPLAASACCLIQIALNVLVSGAGCAGFNTVLGPLRPFFLSLLLLGTFSNTTTAATPITAILNAILSKKNLARWLVALSPEIVHGINTLLSYSLSKSTTITPTTNNIALFPYVATITLEVPTMGCVACINSIDAALRRASPLVLNAASSLHQDKKGGMATVQVAWSDPPSTTTTTATTDILDPENNNELVQSLIHAITNAGFDHSHVQSIEIKERNKQTE